MVSEEKAKAIIIQDVHTRLDAMGYGKKEQGAGMPFYIVKGRKYPMTTAEYTNYCIKKELKKFGIGAQTKESNDMDLGDER